MTGNARNGNKGVDRSKSSCNICGKNFTHTAHSHFNFCPDCREYKKKKAEIKTNAKIIKASDEIQVVIEIENTSDVKVRLSTGGVLSVGEKDDFDDYNHNMSYAIAGYVTVKSDNWYAKNLLLLQKPIMHRYGIKPQTCITYKFNIQNNRLIQKDKPKAAGYGTVGEDLRNEIKINKGEIQDSDVLSVLFEPALEESKLTKSIDSIKEF